MKILWLLVCITGTAHALRERDGKIYYTDVNTSSVELPGSFSGYARAIKGQKKKFICNSVEHCYMKTLAALDSQNFSQAAEHDLQASIFHIFLADRCNQKGRSSAGHIHAIKRTLGYCQLYRQHDALSDEQQKLVIELSILMDRMTGTINTGLK